MRITLDIKPSEMRELQKFTGKRKKAQAIVRALASFLRMRKGQAFIERALAGQTDYALTNEELEARDVYETR